QNEIVVHVYDSAQTGITVRRWPDNLGSRQSTQPPFDAHSIPHGKQDWYINVGGIWQDVTLIGVPSIYIDYARIETDIHTGSASVTVTLTGATELINGGLLRVGVDDVVAATALISGQTTYTLHVNIDSPRLWTPDSPALYIAKIDLQTPSGEDALEVRFGFREIATRDGKLLLNGEPIYLLAALDQDLYPETIYTP